ncbi:MAG: hypothetical protein J0M17_09965, partial [Planctomycetes bacterium]|nr:hypothetical protein [Planctomycetota bacterium]
HYGYTDAAGERQRANVKVGYAFEPLKPNDDFILWSLLSLTLDHSDNHILTATPYWLLKNLGMFTGGHQYQVLRDAVERLSQLLYRNSAFYNPVTQAHERWQFQFFASHLPVTLDADRLWKLVWNQPFIEASRATGGRLLFDLDVFRTIGSPATRRLFLKLVDRFYRSSRVHFDLHDLTINGLGYSPTVPLKARKQKLLRSLDALLDLGIITLGRGQGSTRDLILKREKGRYLVTLFRGTHFEQPVASTAAKKNPADDPLYGPMQTIGVDDPMIGKVLRTCQRSVIERWLKITEAALKDKPQGFPGFKVSPAAFFVDGVLNERMPPDWMYQLEKSQRQKAHAAEVAKMKAAEQLLQESYDREHRDALRAFVQTPHGRTLYQSAYDARLAFNLRQGDPMDIARQNAEREALEWVGRCDEFAFPKMPVWMLSQDVAD